MSGHTPGPWLELDITHAFLLRPLGWGSCTWTFIGPSADKPIAVAICPVAEGDDLDANARLIAAAPEMFEMLQRVEMWLSTFPEGKAMGGAVRTVIKKAGGE